MTEWTAHLLARLYKLGIADEDYQKLLSSPMADPTIEYNHFMHRLCGGPATYPTYPFGTSFPLGSPIGNMVDQAVYPAILKLAVNTLDAVDNERVPGDLVEFGVAAGGWLKMMLDHMEAKSQVRRTWGFDSFEGLPAPDTERDSHGWEAGQFANAKDVVLRTLKGSTRPHLSLVQGWFSDSLKTEAAESIKEIAYAKVDGDLYESAVDCLAFLKGRLSNGAVLMFDEWTYVLHLGETRAFYEWVPSVPEYRFELIGFINYRIFFRVWHAEAAV